VVFCAIKAIIYIQTQSGATYTHVLVYVYVLTSVFISLSLSEWCDGYPHKLQTLNHLQHFDSFSFVFFQHLSLLHSLSPNQSPQRPLFFFVSSLRSLSLSLSLSPGKMDNFLPFPSSNANSVQELSMDPNNNRSHFTTVPTYDHHQAQPHHFLPPFSYPVEQMAAVMNPQPVYLSECYPQIPVTQTGSEFGSLVGNPCLWQERGGFLDPRMTKMARINRKNAMMRSRNNSSPNSSPSELVDSKRQLMMLNLKNNVQISDKKDSYQQSTFDNKVWFLFVPIFEYVRFSYLFFGFHVII